MSSDKWQAVRFSTGDYGVCRKDDKTGIYYCADSPAGPPKKFDEFEEAKLWADTLNGRPTLPRRMSEEGFSNATAHVNLTIDMRCALRLILVEGQTWRWAASAHGVTESGILKAMRRIAERNHPG